MSTLSYTTIVTYHFGTKIYLVSQSVQDLCPKLYYVAKLEIDQIAIFCAFWTIFRSDQFH